MNMKKLLFLLSMSALISCSKNSNNSNYDLLIDHVWKTYEYYDNGTFDPAVVAQEPTFEFRSDNKCYVSQIGPVYKDTFSFVFTNATNIKLTKPSVSSTYYINIKIDRLTDSYFDFTVTNPQQLNDEESYKTQKQ
jgi:hypothetical protein